MFNSTQDVAALGQAQFEKVSRFSTIILSGSERIAALQLELSRKLVNDNLQHLKNLSEIKDPKAFADYQSSLAQPAIDQAFAVARNLYDVAMATQNELVGFIEEQIAESNQQFLSSLDKLAKNAPAGADVAINAVKTFVNSSNSAFETVSKTAKKMSTEIAEAGVEAAANTAKATSAAVARTKKPVTSNTAV